jgi:two-component system response regulator RstA
MSTGAAVIAPLVAAEQVFSWRTEDAGDFSVQHYMLCFCCALACTVQSGLDCYNGGFCAAVGARRLATCVAGNGWLMGEQMAAQQVGGQILIVEDDLRLAELTREYLASNGLAVAIEADGAQAVARILREQPALVILDLMLPGEDGLSICRQLRAQHYAGAILMLTALADDMDQVLGLEMGADDYVCKPVRPRLLLARVHALLRRNLTSAVTSPLASECLAFGALLIDHARREASLHDASIELTSAEFDLLWLLAANSGRILSREEIFTALRGIGYDGLDRSIDVRISRIRPKIGDDPEHPRVIKTVRGKGYLFVAQAAQAL